MRLIFYFCPMISLRELFLRHVAQTSEAPMAVEVERAEGVYLYGPDGKSYIDLISGIAVSNVGHCAPEVVAAIKDQAERYLHTMVYGEYIMGPQVKLAEKIVEVLNSHLDAVFFVNSGSEAVEGALKIAKKYTRRPELIAFHDSYHGSTHGALSVTGSPELKVGYGPFLPEVNFIHFNNWDDLAAITEKTAGVIVELIRGEAGVQLPEPGYLEALRARCDETGTLLIVDEIQTGFGRTGHLFAHQHLGIKPDILLMAKGMGGGMPIGAFIASREIMSVIQKDPVLGHITTFGGHPVSCAAALASLNKILDEKLVEAIPEKEALIRRKMVHPDIEEIRGTGLMFSVKLDSFERVLAVMHHGIENGLIVDWFLYASDRARIAPPLVISLEELEKGLDILLAAINATAAQHVH